MSGDGRLLLVPAIDGFYSVRITSTLNKERVSPLNVPHLKRLLQAAAFLILISIFVMLLGKVTCQIGGRCMMIQPVEPTTLIIPLK